MTRTFHIYDTEYRIEECDNGYWWVSKKDVGELFPEPYLAQQDAMRHESERQEEQAEAYANCRHDYWDKRRE